MENSDPHRQQFVIDRFEDNGWAVLEREDGTTMNVQADWLPPDAKEGDVLVLEVVREASGSSLSFSVDSEGTQERLQESRELLDRLRSKSGDTGGDIEL